MRIYLIKFLTLFVVFPSVVSASVNNDVIDSLVMKQSNIEYHQVTKKGLHQVLLSSPKRINNEIIIEKDIRHEGELHTLLTRLPQASKLSDGFSFYRSLLVSQGKLLFECAQRACGISSHWANAILNERRLLGRDNDQYYVAGTVEYDGETYILSVYLVANALRENLAFINVIKQNDVQADWYNGLLVLPNAQLTKSVLNSIKEQLVKDEELFLYVASYTNKAKFKSVSAMQNTSKNDFLNLQTMLSNELGIETDRIRQQFVGSFYENVIEGESDSWLRLFLFKP